MSEWQNITLSDFIWTNKNTLDVSYGSESILYLDTGSITRGKIDKYQELLLREAPSRARRLVDDGDIIYSAVRPIQRHYGYITNPPENLVVSTGFVVITCKKNLDSKFLYFLLTSDELVETLDIIADGSTSAYPSLKPSDIEVLNLDIPKDVNEQKVIASVLSSLDDKIDLLHRQNKTLESLAEALFHHWFIEEAQDDWIDLPLSEVANFLNGLACQKHPPKNEIDKLPVLKIKELRNGISESSDWATSEVNQEYIVSDGDIIFSWSASLMVELWDGEQCILNQHLFKVTSESFPKWFIFMWCKHHLNEFISISQSHATTMGHIKRGDLDKALVQIPDENNLNEMNLLLEPIFNKKIQNNRQIKSLEKLRDTLLPKLMSGEIRVEH